MANPYYTPPRNTTSPLVQGVGTGAKLVDMYQQSKNQRGKLDLMRQQHELSQRKFGAQQDQFSQTMDYKNRALEQGDRQLDIAEKKTPAHLQDFDPGRVKILRTAMRLGKAEKLFEPVLNDMETLAKNPKVKAVDAYRFLTRPDYLKMKQGEVLENASKELEKAVNDGDTMRAQQVKEFMEQAGDLEWVQGRMNNLFRNTRQSLAAVEQAQQIEAMKAMPEQFGPRVTDQYGNVLQQNRTTNEWEKVTGPPSGMALDVGEDGTVKFRQGVGAGANLERGTKKGLEERVVNAQEGIARLQEIAQSYQPGFQQINTRVKNAWTGLKDKLEGSPLEDWVGKATPEEKQKLEEFSEFKRDALSNINLYIKEITGAQMSEREANRIRKAMPDPGEGLFDGDSPSEFEAKWSRTMRSLKLANARYIYYLKTAPERLESGEVMSLDRFKNRLEDREEELREAGLANEEIAAKLNEEFFSLGQ